MMSVDHTKRWEFPKIRDPCTDPNIVRLVLLPHGILQHESSVCGSRCISNMDRSLHTKTPGCASSFYQTTPYQRSPL